MTFDRPTSGTLLVRSWPLAETPPSLVQVVFDPNTIQEALRGSPAASFVDDNPGPGARLIASLATPAHGKTLTYNLTVTPSGGTAQPIAIKLHWDG